MLENEILYDRIGFNREFTNVTAFLGDNFFIWLQNREEWDLAVAALSPADPAITVIVDEDEEVEHELLHAATA